MTGAAHLRFANAAAKLCEITLYAVHQNSMRGCADLPAKRETYEAGR
ncbi:MAG: hypothetical protein AB7T08_04485 [Hyphomonadaceae bacterium]